MPLADQIRDLTRLTLAELDAAHDYGTNTKVAWRLLEDLVDEHSIRFSVRNDSTGSNFEGDEVLALSEGYIARHLAAATLEQFVSLLEGYILDLIRLWLGEFPGILAANSLRFEAVLKAGDRDEIIREEIDREVAALGYKRVAEWFAYFEKIARVKAIDAAEIDAIAEIKATRDVLIHNRGVVNAIYRSKAGPRARYPIGERIEIPEYYHRKSWESIKKAVRDLADASIRKLEPANAPGR